MKKRIQITAWAVLGIILAACAAYATWPSMLSLPTDLNIIVVLVGDITRIFGGMLVIGLVIGLVSCLFTGTDGKLNATGKGFANIFSTIGAFFMMVLIVGVIGLIIYFLFVAPVVTLLAIIAILLLIGIK